MIREKKKAPRGWTGPTWESTALSITINHAEGEPSVFLSMASSPDAGRSFTANLILLDEWAFQQWAEEIWTSAYPIINRPTGGQVIGLSTSKRNTLFEEIWEKATKGENNFARIFLAWDTDRAGPRVVRADQRDLPNSYMAEYPSTQRKHSQPAKVLPSLNLVGTFTFAVPSRSLVVEAVESKRPWLHGPICLVMPCG